MTTIKSDQEIQDFVRGCTFMGTGGGGNPKDGIAWLTAVRDEGLPISWVDVSSISDDDWTLCPFLMVLRFLAPLQLACLDWLHRVFRLARIYDSHS